MTTPEVLYKYGSSDSVKYYLEKRTLKVADPRAYNDPFEWLPCLDKPTPDDVVSFLRKRGWKYEGLESMSQQLVEKFSATDRLVMAGARDALAEKLGVICFSARNDDLLMWPHYADQHKGVCYGFDTRTIQGMDFQPVVYTNERPLFGFNDALTPELSRAAYDRVALTKSRQWAYEQEYRVILHNRGKPVEPFLAFHPAFLHSVYFGLRCAEETKESARAFLLTQELFHVQIFQAELHPRKYAVTFKQLR